MKQSTLEPSLLAGALAGLDQPAAAVQLAAAANQFFDSMGAQHWPMVDQHTDPLLTQAESSLDATTAEALKKQGRALTLMRTIFENGVDPLRLTP